MHCPAGKLARRPAPIQRRPKECNYKEDERHDEGDDIERCDLVITSLGPRVEGESRDEVGVRSDQKYHRTELSIAEKKDDRRCVRNGRSENRCTY